MPRHTRAGTCQNDIDSMLYALGCTLSVNDRRLSLVVWKHSGVVSTPPVIDSKPPVVDFCPGFLKFVAAKGRLGTSNRHRKVFGLRFEDVFRRLDVADRQLGIRIFKIRGFKSPTGGFLSFA